MDILQLVYRVIWNATLQSIKGDTVIICQKDDFNADLKHTTKVKI